MAEDPSKPTLLNLPPEIRVSLYSFLFVNSAIKVCGYKFKQGHHVDELPDRGKRISMRKTSNQITKTCRKLRYESMPILLNKTVLYCCHLGPRLVDTHLPLLYRQHIRKVSIDNNSFNPKYIHLLRPDVLHRRCKALPTLPQLKVLKIRIPPCYKLREGSKSDTLTSTRRVKTGRTILEEAQDFARRSLLRDSNSFLGRLLLDEDRGFSVRIQTYVGDFYPKARESEKGVAAYFSFDWDTGKLTHWTHGYVPVLTDYYGYPFSKAWYRDRQKWDWMQPVLQFLTPEPSKKTGQ